MTQINKSMLWIANNLAHVTEKAKPLFSAVALFLYALSLIVLARDVSPIRDLSGFLVEALVRLSIPFSVILLQELLELVTMMSGSTLASTQQQFQIVVLVLLRGFFKDFGKLNAKVVGGLFAEPVQKAVVKLLAIVAMTALIVWFQRLSSSATIRTHKHSGRTANLYKEMVVIVLIGLVILNMAVYQRSFEIMAFISLVFTGMIIVDAAFFLISIARGHEFHKLIFEGGLVISLIFARFALFANNTLAYSLSVLGVGFATILLFLFIWSLQDESSNDNEPALGD